MSPQLVHLKSQHWLHHVQPKVVNLSYESLTSHEARQAIRELKTSNPKFHTEITTGRPIELSEEEVEPEENNTTTTDELSSSDHIQIVMSSATAGEVIARVDEADLAADSEDSDDESAYEPPTSEPTGLSSALKSVASRRELPQRAAKANTSYTLQEWWNNIDIDD
ncbi:hypothetical protein FRC11_012514 [Ceratobasidium sp. 423]|nr:hypothetical protein FRC11_012514 [Ceratobasidium sp. 423]